LWRWTAPERSPSSRKAALFWRIAGGVTLGIGIWSMHFIGMLSMQMPMMMSYDLWLTLASLGVAVIASTTALNIAVAGKKLSPFD
jgi:NO-binding membrane sensor protein with MHYT domain